MVNRGKRKTKPLDYLIRGNIVKCGCCGYLLHYDKLYDSVYYCYHTVADPNAKCHKLKISAKKLDKIVLTVIHKKAELVFKCADLSKLRCKTIDERKITDCETGILQITSKQQNQYEKFVLGEIDKEKYSKLKIELNTRFERLNQQLAVMKSELYSTKVDNRAVETTKSAVKTVICHFQPQHFHIFTFNRINIIFMRNLSD